MSEVSNIPKLRFPEFIGEWKEKRLGDIGDFKGGGTPSKLVKEYWHGDIPWISSSDINEQDIHNIKISKFINEVAIKESATKIIPKESVLFISRVGVGKLAINTKEVCTSQDFTSLLPKNISSYFLGYFFLAKNNLLIRYSQGTSIKGFTKKDIEALKLNIPTEPEQTKIAVFLNSIDNKIEQLSKKQELLGEYKKGLMQQIFSQAIRFKADYGSDFPDWEEKKLGSIATFYNSRRVPLTESDRIKGSYPYYGASGVIDYVENYIFDGEYILLGEDGANIVLRNSRLVFLAKGRFWVNNHAHIFQAKESNYFLCEILERINYSKYNTGTAQPKLNSDVVKKIRFNQPALQEQVKIAAFLTEVDNKIEQLNKKQELLGEYKKGLMQQIFSQSIRFKADDGRDFPDWEEKKLGDIFNISAGGDINKSNTNSTQNEKYKYPVYANSRKNKGLYGYSDIYKQDEDCVTVTGRGFLGEAVARYDKFYPIVRLLVLRGKQELNIKDRKSVV